ncbi:MAG: zincin-like metallopeptidase domain-containing protein [Aquabacterium sp.]|uniref:ArdC family protein n=1 Tax=Aquabacterium sp. TaxID=1872578 RepID=UPI003BAE7999
MDKQAARSDVYSRVTARILADLEAGTRPWLKPWRTNGGGALSRPLRHNGTPYRCINVLLLWAEAFDRGFESATWMTYKQAQALGAQVRKGETGSLVVFADRVMKTETNESGDEVMREIAFMKGYIVFNVEQIDNLPAMYRSAVATGAPTQSTELPAAVEVFFANTGAVFEHGGDHAFYAIDRDIIRLPEQAAFVDAESYAATKAHELIHWTRHPSRLNRDFGRRAFGDAGYAKEELVAELGAAFLCADLGITPEPRPDHAAYLASWLRALSDDRRFIFTAAAHAQRAVDYLMNASGLAVMA